MIPMMLHASSQKATVRLPYFSEPPVDGGSVALWRLSPASHYAVRLQRSAETPTRRQAPGIYPASYWIVFRPLILVSHF